MVGSNLNSMPRFRQHRNSVPLKPPIHPLKQSWERHYFFLCEFYPLMLHFLLLYAVRKVRMTYVIKYLAIMQQRINKDSLRES